MASITHLSALRGSFAGISIYIEIVRDDLRGKASNLVANSWGGGKDYLFEPKKPIDNVAQEC